MSIKTGTDILNMKAIGNIFISNNDERNRKFGIFRDGDIQKKAYCKDASSQTVWNKNAYFYGYGFDMFTIDNFLTLI